MLLARVAFRFVLAAACVAAQPARADSDDVSTTQKPQNRPAAVNAARAIGKDEVEGPTIFEGIRALNPIDAARDDLRDIYGVYLHGQYMSDPYIDVAGGQRRGGAYAGRLDIQLDVDAKKVVGLEATTLHANMFQIHGADISQRFVGNFLSSNDIAALPTTRLYELWVDHRFGDKVSVRAGQQGIDVEFLTSDYGANFINATFGWPGLPSLDLPQGGPAYPLATPAVRVKLDPTSGLTILAAAFDGLPAGPGPGDPQVRDRTGTSFRISDPPLLILEAQYRYNRGEGADGFGLGLPGTLKLSAFSHLGSFDDQRLSTGGVPLALAGPRATPLQHSPDVGGYVGLDQQIYRLPGEDDEKGIGFFARAIGAPGDRNPIDFYADAGLFAFGLVTGRPGDGFGIAAAFAKFSGSARAADRDANLAAGLAAPVRDYEAVIEATYDAVVLPGLTIQPTVQYVVHPGGNVANPLDNGLAPIPNALIVGATTTVRF